MFTVQAYNAEISANKVMQKKKKMGTSEMGSVKTASSRVIEQWVELGFAILACFQVLGAGFRCAEDWK